MTAARMLPAATAAFGDLPVRSVLGDLVAALDERGTAVLVAPPGSGKTSLLPLALADAAPGTVIVAEPRRIATRAAASRLATLIGERPGGRIGYAMRGEKVAGTAMRIEVVTTGLLVQRLQREPDLSGVSAVVIDECHERHLDADLALAFCIDVRANLRADLRLVATSATPDTDRLARSLAGGAPVPVVTASARVFDVEVEWAPPVAPLPLLPDARVDPRLLDHVAAVVRRALTEADGDVLVFVPGEAEIAGVARRLGRVATVLPLFGRQSRAEQERALTPGPGRRVVVTTSVAESSLTVPGVRIVVDAGLARQARIDQTRGLGSLVTTRVSKASAEQRAGRAGREGPGRVYRCWSPAEHAHLEAHTPPEIAVADLAGFALTAAAWGAPGGVGLALLDPPPAPALAAAEQVLRGLDALDATGRITAKGRRMAAVAAHPRLARAILDGARLVGARRAREIVALLSDDTLAGRDDDLPGRWRELRRGLDRDAAERWRAEVRRLTSGGGDTSNTGASDTGTSDTGASDTGASDTGAGVMGAVDAVRGIADDLAVGTTVGLAYPERLARARSAGSATYLMAGGTGAALAPASVLRGTEWLAVAVADRPVGRADARIRSAAPLDEATALTVGSALLTRVDEIRWDDGELILRRRESLGAITIGVSPLADPDPALVAAAVADGLRRSGLEILHWSAEARQLRQRLAFCHAHIGPPWPAVDDDALLAGLDRWLGPELAGVRRTRDLAAIAAGPALRRLLPWPAAANFDEFAPQRLRIPTGALIRLVYDGAQAPVLRVKVQEAFGWLDTPALAGGRVPVVLHLLSPAGRPVAITADLRSFWRQGYPQVRADLRARYPRHAWPENPLSGEPAAQPTSRPTPRKT